MCDSLLRHHDQLLRMADSEQDSEHNSEQCLPFRILISLRRLSEFFKNCGALSWANTNLSELIIALPEAEQQINLQNGLCSVRMSSIVRGVGPNALRATMQWHCSRLPTSQSRKEAVEGIQDSELEN